ncbi:MAG: NAD(P)(+) transhydrogenase (Re/Si-specific) subunit alpha, partial [Arenicellales bacterium]
MIIGIPTESALGERRVAIAPVTIPRIIELGFAVQVQSGAGEAAGFSDDEYLAGGAMVAGSREVLWDTSDIIVKIRAPEQTS